MTAWDDIVSRHGRVVWETAWRMLGNHADALDCYQRSFLDAVEVARRETVRDWPALLRRAKDGHAFVTDSGHWILDAAFERIADPKSLAERLDGITGVVEHGLFIGLAHAAVIAGSSGVRVVERR